LRSRFSIPKFAGIYGILARELQNRSTLIVHDIHGTLARELYPGRFISSQRRTTLATPPALRHDETRRPKVPATAFPSVAQGGKRYLA
jgi:hypothetical protein